MSVTSTIILQLASTDTGKTITVKLYNNDNQQVGSTITEGITELELGEYEFIHTFDDDFVGTIRFFADGQYQTTYPYEAAAAATQIDLTPVLAAIDNLEARLASGTVTVVSPFEAGSVNFTIRRGDDYSVVLGNCIRWTSGGWPDLSTATSILFAAKNVTTDDYDLEDIALAYEVDPYTEDQSLSLCMTSVQTQALKLGRSKYYYDIQATIDSNVLTLVSGSMHVVEDVEGRE